MDRFDLPFMSKDPHKKDMNKQCSPRSGVTTVSSDLNTQCLPELKCFFFVNTKT